MTVCTVGPAVVYVREEAIELMTGTHELTRPMAVCVGYVQGMKMEVLVPVTVPKLIAGGGFIKLD